MKRFGSLLLALCLFSAAACAQTVAEQLGAPEHIALDPFQTKSGLSTFLVDAQVQAPPVSGLNTYAYQRLPITEETLQRLAHALALEDLTIAPFTGAGAETQRAAGGTASSYSKGGGVQLTAVNRFFSPNGCDSRLNFDDLTLATQEDCGAYPDMWLWPCHDAAAPDTDYPFADATALALQTVEQFDPDMTLVQAGMYQSYRQLTDAEIRRLNDPNFQGEKPQTRRFGAYGFLFARTVDGVAVASGSSAWFPGDVALELEPVTHEALALVIKDGRVVSLSYAAPGKAGAVEQADVELLPFAQVLALASSGLLQVGEMQEQALNLAADGRTASYSVDSIALRYLCVRAREDPNAFMLIPVWNFYGQQSLDPDPNAWMPAGTLHRELLLTLNAMDGAIVDGAYAY